MSGVSLSRVAWRAHCRSASAPQEPVAPFRLLPLPPPSAVYGLASQVHFSPLYLLRFREAVVYEMLVSRRTLLFPFSAAMRSLKNNDGGAGNSCSRFSAEALMRERVPVFSAFFFGRLRENHCGHSAALRICSVAALWVAFAPCIRICPQLLGLICPTFSSGDSETHLEAEEIPVVPWRARPVGRNRRCSPALQLKAKSTDREFQTLGAQWCRLSCGPT